jgi:hypothetical protein
VYYRSADSAESKGRVESARKKTGSIQYGATTTNKHDIHRISDVTGMAFSKAALSHFAGALVLASILPHSFAAVLGSKSIPCAHCATYPKRVLVRVYSADFACLLSYPLQVAARQSCQELSINSCLVALVYRCDGAKRPLRSLLLSPRRPRHPVPPCNREARMQASLERGSYQPHLVRPSTANGSRHRYCDNPWPRFCKAFE